MARRDLLNLTSYVQACGHPGISLLRARFSQQSFSPHMHSELVLATTVEGRGRFECLGTSHVAVPGHLLVTNPYDPHRGGTIQGETWVYYALYIDAAQLARFRSRLSGELHTQLHVRSGAIDDHVLCNLFLVTHHMLLVNRNAGECDCAVFDLLAQLLRRHGDLRHASLENRHRDVMLGVVDNYVRRNLKRTITIAELSRLLHCSESHFIHSFHKHVGMPPHAYILQARLEEARGLLLRGHSLAQAAGFAGFCDQSHLNRHFKRVYGITPAQYLNRDQCTSGPAGAGPWLEFQAPARAQPD
jgi:AraC-like DNA-binding protein